MSDEELRNKFASAVLSWITEATEALSNCPTILTSDMEHVSSMQAQCAEAYSHMVYGRPTNHDAAPAATASDGGDDGLQARLAGTGDTPKAVAWVIRLREGVVVTYSRDTAYHWRAHGHAVTEITPPRATAPLATKEELKALRNAIEDATVIQIRNDGLPLARVYARQEQALLSLLSKLGGAT